jgi:hypothetical protein
MLVLLMIGVVFSMPDINLGDFPRMEDYYSYECADEADMINKATGGTIDTALDVRDPDNVALLNGTGYNWNVYTTPGYGIHISNFNCRDVYPETAGEMRDYHGRTPGDSNFPLNVSQFRLALKVLIAPPKMDEWCTEVFDWTQVPLETVITPAHGDWYNANLTTYTYSQATAMSLLNGVGFFNDTADAYAAKGMNPGWANFTDIGGQDGWWFNINPDIGPTIELRQIYVMCCIEAISSTAAISIREHASWDNFFGTNSDGNPYIVDESLAWTFTDLLYVTFWDRTFDISSHGWRLGKNPDYVYDFFHPVMDYPWGDNAAGLDVPAVNDKEYAVKFWRWPNGTYVESVAEMKDILWDLQEDLYYLEPFAVTYQEVNTNAYHPDINDVILSYGYGSDVWETYMYNYYTDTTDTDMPVANSGPITSLNTGYLSSVYDYAVHGLVNEGLWLSEASDAHLDVNWSIIGWEFESWADPAINVDFGQKVTFHIRPGVYWQDGDEWTADDIAFSYRTIENLHLAQFATIDSTLVYSDVKDKYTIDIYMNCTGLWFIYDYIGAANMFNYNVWKPLWDHPVEAETFQPWATDYDDWMLDKWGVITDTGQLTCIVGTGPYLFVEWDQVAGVAHLTANRPDKFYSGQPGYWRTSAVVSSVNGPTFMETSSPVTYEFSINFESLDWFGTQSYTINSADIYCCNGTVTPITGLAGGSLANYTRTTSGTYTVTLDTGEHHIIINVTTTSGPYAGETYIADKPIYVTRLEDTNRDIKVDMRDIGTAARAFGSYPGHLRWSYISDINHDHKVDMRDIGQIARYFGWEGPTCV